ncbi:MAG TPA: hypothetical protein VFT84_14730 [Gemmatimonadales bacterium]|nr:hypothetical protein [Gemmatimonadales bacterium]
MTDQPRDWDKELADIDRMMAKTGGAAGQGGGGAVAPRAAVPAPGTVRAAPAARRGSVAITWLWVMLAVGLAVALPLWPYQRTCGLQAAFFLGAIGVTLLVGGLAALSSWANQRGLAHVVSLAVIAWAATMAAREILPRVGYAREARTWTCASAPAAQPVPAPTQQAAPAPTGQTAPAPAGQAPAPTGPEPAPVSP